MARQPSSDLAYPTYPVDSHRPTTLRPPTDIPDPVHALALITLSPRPTQPHQTDRPHETGCPRSRIGQPVRVWVSSDERQYQRRGPPPTGAKFATKPTISRTTPIQNNRLRPNTNPRISRISPRRITWSSCRLCRGARQQRLGPPTCRSPRCKRSCPGRCDRPRRSPGCSRYPRQPS